MTSKQQPKEEKTKIFPPLTVLDGFIKPGFPGKVYTAIFLDDCVVFLKTGFGSTNIAAGQRAFHGGAGLTATLMSGIGSLADQKNRENRMEKAASMASYDGDQMVAAHKHNFKLNYSDIKNTIIKGPNFAGEVRIVFEAASRNKFRVDNQSKASAKYIIDVVNYFTSKDK
ncbi:MAG TPA: hypothetical protein PLM49_07250 [Bacteroidales bacterium]|nr:hypothetical protein [Bacteroidales bacterium]